MMPYEYQHNRLRKAAALKRCVAILERLQENYCPIFSDDAMIQGYLEQMHCDITELESLTEEEKQFQKPEIRICSE